MTFLSFLRPRQFLPSRLIRTPLPALSYKVTAATSQAESTLLPFLRQLHTDPISFTKLNRSTVSHCKQTMADKPSTSISTRRRSQSHEQSEAAPPFKKPMFSIFDKKSDKPQTTADIRWQTHKSSFIVGEAFSPKAGQKVAAFDLDQTLIKVNGKHKWPKNADDWVWWAPSVPTHLQEVVDAGYTIVIVTNQNGLDGRPEKQVEMKAKFEKICARLRLPMWILITMKKDQYRKPMTGLWHWLEAKFHEDGVEIDLGESYYVGDAAGRHDGWKVGAIKDFNNTDRKFAHTLGIAFHTPDHFFLKQACPDDKWSFGTFNPKAWSKDAPLFSPTSTPLLPPPGTCEVIVFCGFPASGKSTFAHKHILSTDQYDYVNQDTLKTKEKCVKAVEESLRNKRAVVVDNTNADKATRASYVAMAKKYNVPVRCFLFMADKHLAMHNNYFRAFHRPLIEAVESVPKKTTQTVTTTTTTTTTTSNVEDGSSSTSTSTSKAAVTVTKVKDEPVRERLSEMVFLAHAKRYQEPTLDEGFSEIKKINFVPDEELRDTWERWYV